jgi:membrane-bound metal-dependent hydrolase YbcI (DUF457 family)
MIAGHFGFAAVSKSASPETPLWALMLATVWLDVLFVPLFLMGVESLAPVAGRPGGYGAYVIHADYTHSLLGAIVLSGAFGAAFYRRWGRSVATVLALVAFSHWVLDLLVHRADMPFLPGNAGHLPTVGFGLWRHPVVAATVELCLVVAGAWLYWRAARAVTVPGSPARARAGWLSLLVLAGGVGVLALDVSGVLG